MAIPRKEDKAITDKDFHNFFFFKFCLKKFLCNMYLWSQFPIHLQTSKLVLSYKLWCYTRISSPEKSPNNSRCAYLWAIELNTRREIPYLRAPTYYSLFIESGSTLKSPNLSSLAACYRKVKTWLKTIPGSNLILKSRKTLHWMGFWCE